MICVRFLKLQIIFPVERILSIVHGPAVIQSVREIRVSTFLKSCVYFVPKRMAHMISLHDESCVSSRVSHLMRYLFKFSLSPGALIIKND